MIKQVKRTLIAIGTITIIALGTGVFLSFQKEPAAEQIVMTLHEQERFQELQKVKIVTEEEIRGAFSETAFKITGYEEKGMESKKKIHDDYYQKMIEEDDSFFMAKGKQFINELNKRELYAHFVVDYGLGFDFERLVHAISVDEYTGKVRIPTPELVLTNFYIDPTFSIEEESGAMVKLLNREFTTNEKRFLIQKMEEAIKQDILGNEQTEQVAIQTTKNKIIRLLEAVNPDITVTFY